MSWGIQFKNKEDFIAGDIQVYNSESNQHEKKSARDSFFTEEVFGELKEEVLQQYEAGRTAVHTLINSGAVGLKDGDYSIAISGHANPKHEKTVGYTNDYISITISQI